MRSWIFVASLLLASSAHAANDSAYTNYDLTKCKQIEPGSKPGEGESSPTYECKGYKGQPVTFVEGDLRSFVAFGKDGRNHCAFRETFSGFNSVGNKVEWRLKDGAPIATILRWSVSYDPEDSAKQKSWLVVTKLEGRNSCHMAYVEGGFPQANDKARALADTAAADYSCAKSTPEFFANPGTETDSIATSGPCEAEGQGD
jgi:hypothetical protein